MNLAVIDANGIVHNVVAVDENTLEGTKQFWEERGFTWVENAICSIGDSYIDGQFIRPPQPDVLDQNPTGA